MGTFELARVAAAVAVLAFLAAGAAGTAAAATAVDDCTTIDAPGTYRLTTDVAVTGAVANGSCVEIAANDTVLDGDGHVLRGDGSGDGVTVTGVRNVTVTDVNATGWSVGIAVENGAEGLVLEGNDLVGNGFGTDDPGVLLEAGARDSPPRVIRNSFRRNLNGLMVGGTTDALVRGNDFVDNLRSGVVVTGSSHGTEVRDNLITGADLGVEDPAQLASNGVFVSLSSAVRVEDNTITKNGNGVQLYFLAGSAILDNEIERNTRGVWVRGQWEQMAAHCNRIDGNDAFGIENNGDTVFNVTRNYWGARSGPGGGAADGVTGATADGGGDAVSDDLNWDPFLATPGCGDGDDGGEDNEPPEADVDVRPEEPAVGDVVRFDGGDSSDPDGTVVAYDWEIDGADAGSGETVRHVFEEPHSTHTVTLTVTDDDGATDVVHREVTVTEDDDCEEDDGVEREHGDDGDDDDCEDDGDDCEEGEEDCDDDDEDDCEAGGDDCDDEDDEEDDSVTVCHVTPAGERTLEIPRPALEAHLDHGDRRGPCDGDGPGASIATRGDGGADDGGTPSEPTTVASPSSATRSPSSLVDRVVEALGELLSGLF